ncbi:hypothetical protein [Kineosporia succinea]|uniref:Uncharacterized protein n=1 Tax=Kineosporia succinea TaxID=84632 RepID=A0ABT9P9K6_9ACTN|nr:hypothetical protein [Kineosporia succinea]MDP9829372.1 hypothetical protein [Kineosporia succinea]
MTTFTEYAEAFAIFAKYQPQGSNVSAEHDEIWAGPAEGYGPISNEDQGRLRELGWTHDGDDSYGWHLYV